jgi:hypothetical protein
MFLSEYDNKGIIVLSNISDQFSLKPVVDRLIDEADTLNEIYAYSYKTNHTCQWALENVPVVGS